MRNFKECCLGVLLIIKLSISLTSCQRITADNDLKNNKVSFNRFAYLDFKIADALTLEQLSNIFPKQLGGLEKTGVKIDRITQNVTAFYGNHKYEVSIIDDFQNNFSNVHLFKKKYRKWNSDKIGEKTIKTVRDGYKTITTIDNSQKTSISFVFKNRYIFKITGTNNQTPYMVWRFLELNKFDKLHE